MKVLWIVNIKLPALSLYLGETPMAVGGWLSSAIEELKRTKDLEIAVATISNCKEIKKYYVDGIQYFLVPKHKRNTLKYDKKLEKEWKSLNDLYQPDIVHIHGTEFPHTLAWVKACGGKNVCVSIQGLVSVISRYYSINSLLDYIPISFRDLVRLDWISKQRNSFHKRGQYEIDLIKSISHVIGRTEWDKTHVLSLNPQIKYHYCGETLRKEFYKHKWDYNKCIPYSIFVSQGNYPIKGVHKVLQALPFILRKFPKTKLYIGGVNILSYPWYRKTSYAIFLQSLIKKYHLEKHVEFTGVLDEVQMCKQYLRSNVFLLSSAIENSPNSVGEAQLLKMPIVVSYCGGTPEIVNYNPKVLYRYEEIEMLASKICDVFSKKNKIKVSGEESVNRYNRDCNTSDLLKIYNEIYTK